MAAQFVIQIQPLAWRLIIGQTIRAFRVETQHSAPEHPQVNSANPSRNRSPPGIVNHVQRAPE